MPAEVRPIQQMLRRAPTRADDDAGGSRPCPCRRIVERREGGVRRSQTARRILALDIEVDLVMLRSVISTRGDCAATAGRSEPQLTPPAAWTRRTAMT